MNVFKHFRHFICISLCIVFIFTFSQFSKPKEVKAIEPVTTLSFATYLLVGGLATMCGVKFASMPKEARYDFISGGFEAIKDVANWGVDGQGLATKLILNEATIKAFLEYVQNKEGSSVLTDGKCDVTDGYYRVPFSVVQNDSKAWLQSSHIVLNDNYDSKLLRLYVYGSDGSLVTSIFDSYQKSFYIVTRHCYSNMSEFAFLYSDGSISGNIPSIPKTSSILYLYIPENLVDNVSVLDKTVVYPKNLTDVRGIEDYTKQWDKTNVGQQSIEVDGAKTGVDVSTPIEGSNSLTDDIVFPAGIEEGVEVPGLKINAGEGSIEASPDTSKDDTLEHQSILQDILDWIGSLFLSLFKFLLDLLEKLIQLLKELLISLFVPSDAFVQEKVDILKNQLEPKLPYAQYIKLFDSSYEGNELKDIIINIYGQDVVIAKVTLFERFRDLFNTGVYAVMFFLLAIYNYNNIYKLIRGTDYVSATNTINNATGGTRGSGKGGGD